MSPLVAAFSVAAARVVHPSFWNRRSTWVRTVLGISPSTVRTHVERVFQKLGCTTRAAATLKAATRGLI